MMLGREVPSEDGQAEKTQTTASSSNPEQLLRDFTHKNWIPLKNYISDVGKKTTTTLKMEICQILSNKPEDAGGFMRTMGEITAQ